MVAIHGAVTHGVVTHGGAIHVTLVPAMAQLRLVSHAPSLPWAPLVMVVDSQDNLSRETGGEDRSVNQ